MVVRSIETEKPTDAVVVAAPYAPAGPIVAATSSTPANPQIGGPGTSYVFKLNEAGLGFMPGFRVRIASQDVPDDAWIEGIVTAFDGVNLTLTADLVSGFGTWAAWNVNVAGEPGLEGPEGPAGPPGPPGGMIDEPPNDNQLYGRKTDSGGTLHTWVRALAVTGDVLDGGNF
jgi:hypothetical protein